MVLLVGLGLGCVECMSSGNEHGGSGAAVQRGKSFAGIPAGFARAAQSVLNQGNSSLVKTAATAAGAQLLKKTLSGLDIKQKLDDVFQNKQARGGPGASTAQQPFNAIRQDLQDMIQQGEQWVGGFRAGEKSQTDAKWLPTDWQELRETFSVPPGWSAIANDLNLRANMVQREVQNNIDGIQASVSEYLEESRKKVDSLKRSLSSEAFFLDGANTWPSGKPGQSVWDAWTGEGGVLEKWVQYGTDARSSVKERFLSRFEQVRGHVDAMRQAAGSMHGSSMGEGRKAKVAEAEVTNQNNLLVSRLFNVMDEGEWEHILARDGVNVYRRPMIDANGQGSKFYCIKAVSTINAKAVDVYELLKDPDRVREYNDECAEAQELPALSSDTRLTWASSKKYGPFKPRDFITRVHHRQMKDGTFVVMTQSEDVDFHKAGKEHFVRTEVLLAGNVMRPNDQDPSKTDFVTIAHINPGGAADTPLGAKIVNHLCTHGPVNFIMKLEGAASRRGSGS